MQKRPSLPNTSPRWSTTPRSLESAIRQPPSGCAAYARADGELHEARRGRCARRRRCIAALAASRTRDRLVGQLVGERARRRPGRRSGARGCRSAAARGTSPSCVSSTIASISMWLLKVESACFFCRPHHDGSPVGSRAVVVEDVRERRQEDLLEREARAVVRVAGPAGPEVVGHRRDRLALVELAVAGQPEHVADLLLVVLDRGDVVAVDAEVLADLAREARQAGARAHQERRRCPSRRPRGSAPCTRSRTSLPVGWRVGFGAVVVDLGDGHDVAVGPRRALARSSSTSRVRPHLHAQPLGRGEVVGDHRVLGAEDAAGVAPLRLDAAVRGRSRAARGRRCARRRRASPPTARPTSTTWFQVGRCTRSAASARA